MSPKAAAYLEQLRLRRPDADAHLGRIMALTGTYTKAKVADAIAEAVEMSIYGADYIENILDMRKRAEEEFTPQLPPEWDNMEEEEMRQPDLGVYERRR